MARLIIQTGLEKKYFVTKKYFISVKDNKEFRTDAEIKETILMMNVNSCSLSIHWSNCPQNYGKKGRHKPTVQ